MVENNKIEIELYTKPAGSGLKTIQVKKISIDPTFVTTKLNVLGIYFKYLRDHTFLGWNGYISMLCADKTNYEVSKIIFLPFINGQPSDYSTLFTALKNAAVIISKEGINTCIVTFDQPLYIKAGDIIASSVFDDN